MNDQHYFLSLVNRVDLGAQFPEDKIAMKIMLEGLRAIPQEPLHPYQLAFLDRKAQEVHDVARFRVMVTAGGKQTFGQDTLKDLFTKDIRPLAESITCVDISLGMDTVETQREIDIKLVWWSFLNYLSKLDGSKEKMPKTCAMCGNWFIPNKKAPTSKRKFCSVPCKRRAFYLEEKWKRCELKDMSPTKPTAR